MLYGRIKMAIDSGIVLTVEQHAARAKYTVERTLMALRKLEADGKVVLSDGKVIPA